MNPRISVIVPVYNTEKYLRRCVDSILAQTFTDFELLLIDDGSKDSSGAICDEYAVDDQRVRVLHKPNGGASSARNLGLDNAHGEWITFADSDDYVYNNWLENYANHFEGRYDLIIQGIDTDKGLNGKGTPSSHGLDFVKDHKDALITLYLNGIVGYTVVKAFRRGIIHKFGLRFDEDIKLREDELFVLDYLSIAGTVKSISTPGYYYFVPDWDKKYNLEIDDEIKLATKLISTQSMYRKEYDYFFFNSPLGFLTDCLIKKYIYNRGGENWRNHLDEIKNILKEEPKHPMNKYLKKFIITNPFDILSKYILSFYYTKRYN